MSAAPTYASGSRVWQIPPAIAPVCGLSFPSATMLKQRRNTKHPAAERNRSHKIALYVRMRLAIDVFIARPYSDQARMNVHSCSLREAISSRPRLEVQRQCKTSAALKKTSPSNRQRSRSVQWRKSLESIRAGDRYKLHPVGIAPVPMYPDRFGRFARLPISKGQTLNRSQKDSHAVAFFVEGIRRHTAWDLGSRECATHPYQTDSWELATNYREQFKARHFRHVEVGKRDLRILLIA
jgi:hypothetical protein